MPAQAGPREALIMADRLKIAAVINEYRPRAHGQHIVDRFLDGYGWNGRWHRPEMDLVSLYVDQSGESDLSRERETRFPQLTIYPTVADTLTLGGSSLAVDGVLLIGEHGTYGQNEKGQHLYPRYELFKQIVAVFRASGRAVPVFNDKHLSWKWEWAKEMFDISREMGFAFMAGSSLPVTHRIPAIEMPLGANVGEAMVVAVGAMDSYDIHALEAMQCMVERRNGGESGVKWLKAYSDDEFWEAHESGLWSRELFNAILCRATRLNSARPGFNHIFPTTDDLKKMVLDPESNFKKGKTFAYHYEHNDGLKCTMIMLNGVVQEFTVAVQIEGRDDPWAVSMYLPINECLADFFNPLTNNIEKMFLTGKPTYPVERTLLCSGLVCAGVDSIFAEGARQETPHLNIAYQPTAESTFWRD